MITDKYDLIPDLEIKKTIRAFSYDFYAIFKLLLKQVMSIGTFE